MMELAEFKLWFDEQFAVLLEAKIAEFNGYSSSSDVHSVSGYIQTLAREGKRFRPYMVYVGYMAHGGTENIFPLMAAVELLHLFALVHDDIMDEARTRHGVETTHTKFGSLYQNARLGESLAILQGDILMAWAYELVQSVGSVDISGEFNTLVSEVIHGQMMDTFCTVSKSEIYESIEQKMQLKTAHYSFYRPLLMGAVLAKADRSSQDFIKEFATNLGIAFQIKDDVLDTRPESETGKPSCTDIKVRQQTYLTWFMEHSATREEQQIFTFYFGNKTMTIEDEKKLVELLETSGALSFAKEKMNDYFTKSENAITSYRRLDTKIWNSIINVVRSRVK